MLNSGLCPTSLWFNKLLLSDNCYSEEVSKQAYAYFTGYSLANSTPVAYKYVNLLCKFPFQKCVLTTSVKLFPCNIISILHSN